MKPEEIEIAAEQPKARRHWQDVLGDDPRFAGTKDLACQFESIVRALFPVPSDQHRILDALAAMVCLHRNQKARPDGTPYVSHPLATALYVLLKFECSDQDILIAALLHDSIEDQADKLVAPCVAMNLPPLQLRRQALQTLGHRFGKRVAGLVGLLVNPYSEESPADHLSEMGEAEKEATRQRLYWEHFEALWDGDPDALLIKLADFSQNALRLDQLEESSKKDGLRRKYGPVIQTSIIRLERLDDPGHPLFGAKDWLLANLREAYARDYDT